jgi:hypothetical protein
MTEESKESPKCPESINREHHPHMHCPDSAVFLGIRNTVPEMPELNPKNNLKKVEIIDMFEEK